MGVTVQGQNPPARAPPVEQVLGVYVRAVALEDALRARVVIVNPDDIGRTAFPAIIANHGPRRIESLGQVI